MKLVTIMLLVLMLVMLVMVGAAAFAADKGATAPLVIDVRTQGEWDSGHLEGAVLIPLQRIENGYTSVAADKKTKIHLYCRTGRRTAIAAGILKKAGYENIVDLKGMDNAAKVLQRPIVK